MTSASRGFETGSSVLAHVDPEGHDTDSMPLFACAGYQATPELCPKRDVGCLPPQDPAAGRSFDAEISTVAESKTSAADLDWSVSDIQIEAPAPAAPKPSSRDAAEGVTGVAQTTRRKPRRAQPSRSSSLSDLMAAADCLKDDSVEGVNAMLQKYRVRAPTH